MIAGFRVKLPSNSRGCSLPFRTDTPVRWSVVVSQITTLFRCHEFCAGPPVTKTEFFEWDTPLPSARRTVATADKNFRITTTSSTPIH
jgi:hypothetical protein